MLLLPFSASSDKEPDIAIQGYLTGSVQTVGMRGRIFKIALQHGLVGTICNVTKRKGFDCNNGKVAYFLQGKKSSIHKALIQLNKEVQELQKKSSSYKIDIHSPKSVPLQLITDLKIIDWTSVTRCLSTPQTVSYTYPDGQASMKAPKAHKIWKKLTNQPKCGAISPCMSQDDLGDN